MPPRYAYWTIIVDNQPTAFRSGSQEELLPTFKRLKAKHDTAVMMWFQNGKLWPSRVDAQEAMHARGEMGRRGDERQAGRPGFRDRAAGSKFGDRDRKPTRERSAWTPRGEPSTPAPARNADDKLDWKPKGEFVPAPKRAERPDWKPKSDWKSKPDWKPKSEAEGRGPRRSPEREGGSDWRSKASKPQSSRASGKPEWKPKTQASGPKSFKRPSYKPTGDDTRSAKPEWKPKGSFTPAPRRSEGSDWKPKGSFDRQAKRDWSSKASKPQSPRASAKPEWKPKTSERPQWTPRSQAPGPKSPDGEKRKWVPKEEYKKSMGIEARRDSKWRPGGEHKDPKQKYKDAKKAKWTKFKQNIRARSGGKGKKES